jgi:hypothetical protein
MAYAPTKMEATGIQYNTIQTVAGLFIWGVLSDERAGLSFTAVAGPRPRSHSRVPRLSLTCFRVSDSRLPQPGGSGPRIYPPGTG